MSMTAQNLIDRAAKILNDVANVRWTQQDLVGYINDGQREIVSIKPDANITQAAAQLATGTTLQALPSGGITLIDITRNMGADGTTAGKAIRPASRTDLDTRSPNWHTDAASSTGISLFTFDPNNPRRYFIYPKAPATAWYVELVYSALPTDLPYSQTDGSNTTALSLGDIYANALLNYILHRTYLKNAEYAANGAAAAAYYQAFAAGLGLKAQADAARNPNIKIGVVS